VTLYVWAALGISIVAVVASILFAVSRALAAWRAFRRLRRKVFEALGDVARRAGGIEQRLGKAGESAQRLERATADLQDSLATTSVLAAAFADVRAAVSRVAGVVPSK
jgi:hypothetical protein